MRDSSSVAELADFTSYSFRAAGQNATLADELRNIDRYLNLPASRPSCPRLRRPNAGNPERDAEMEVRSLTGIGAEKAVAAH